MPEIINMVIKTCAVNICFMEKPIIEEIRQTATNGKKTSLTHRITDAPIRIFAHTTLKREAKNVVANRDQAIV